ncbi:hypothetical protein AUR04nite_28030 [Glutamicibacter uratoxydans]|uniref:Lipoprotein n=1 Tax=Glutamicibacter uratoxydans TaxID=43667 RepID=A0A4Y4DY26_GLUUR|nr:hypothetical protein [Glutamicibacter uratoxydans]GED07271.1 hypothetical protein AUR04nite_28030 [Glutamicibacter uratoxydans]
MNQRHRNFLPVTGGLILAAAALLLAGCGGAESEAKPEAAAQVRDLSNGGSCTDGEDIIIAANEATPVIEGACGSVKITGSGVRGNIAQADSVEITGSQVTLLGTQWGNAQITGEDVTLNVDELEKLDSQAKGTHLTGKNAGEVVLGADGAGVNADVVKVLKIDGSNATVLLDEISEVFEVHGNGNTINWSSGLEAPSVDTGTGNTYTF